MTAVKYAYVGYQLTEDWQVQAGITQVPFGNWPYNSHNYFSAPIITWAWKMTTILALCLSVSWQITGNLTWAF